MFEKNLEILTREEAERIRRKRAAVIGLGALGQMAAHLLVRSGFEELTLCDGDRMEESNRNRQLYADVLTLGMPKTEAVSEKLCDISPRLKLREYDCFLDPENGREILKGADLVLDCVDRIPVKLFLQELAEEMGIPLIHGAVEGWFGQVCTVFPGDRSLSVLYGKQREQGVTALMPTVAVTASVQAAEAVKAASGETPSFRGTLFCADLKSGEFGRIRLPAGKAPGPCIRPEQEGK